MVEEPRRHVLLAPPDACGLLASVLAVVEREAANKPLATQHLTTF